MQNNCYIQEVDLGSYKILSAEEIANKLNSDLYMIKKMNGVLMILVNIDNHFMLDEAESGWGLYVAMVYGCAVGFHLPTRKEMIC